MTVPDSSAGPRTVPAIWGNVPQRNRNFTGREDILARLSQGAASGITAVLPDEPLPVALQGLGGVGKTSVAIEYAHRHRSDYELVWWIQADQLPLVRSSLAALAEALGLETARATGIEAAAAAVLDALRRGEPYRRWLLIFDNADEPDELYTIIPQGPGDVLITSRNNRWQSVIDTVPLNVFTRPESKDFLAKRVGKELSESEADQIAEKLGDLPLALEQAGAVQAETGMPVDEYLRLLDEHVTQIMAEGKSVEYPMSMTAAWKLSVTKLRQQLPEALELLRCCAFFAPDPIPRDVFRRGNQANGTRIQELTADPISLARAVRELGRFALVNIDGRALSVHRLIQALLRDELESAEQAAYQHEVHLILAAAAPADPDDSRSWPRYEELVPHIVSPVGQLAQCTDSSVRTIALDIVRYLYLSGDVASSRSLAEQLSAQWTKDSGPDHIAVVDVQRHLGNTLRQLGQYPQARRITEEALRRSQATFGEQHPLTLALRSAFGADLRARGDFSLALAMDEQTRELHETIFGPTDPQKLRAMHNLARDYGHICKYDTASELLQQVFVLMSAADSGISFTELLTSWTGLAWVVRCTGNYAAARDVSEDARDYGLEKLGAAHYATVRSSIGLSTALRRTGNTYEESLEIANEIYDLCQRVHGRTHPDTLAAAINLANIQRTTGQVDAALTLAEPTITHFSDAYGPDHPYSYCCIGNLALLRRLAGDPEEARHLNEAALAGLDQKLTRDHDYSLVVAMNLTSDLAALGENTEARARGEDTLKRLHRLLGEDHPLTLACAANLALDHRADGATGLAESLTAETMGRYNATLGTDHPDAVDAAAGRRLNFDFDPPLL